MLECISIYTLRVRRRHTSAYVRIRPHTSACVSMRIRQHASAYVSIHLEGAEEDERHQPKHTSAYVSIHPHTSAYVIIRKHTPWGCGGGWAPPAQAYVSIRQHTSAYVSIRQHTSAYTLRVRRRMSATSPSRNSTMMNEFKIANQWTFLSMWLYISIYWWHCIRVLHT
jgi:hypothetical protein